MDCGLEGRRGLQRDRQTTGGQYSGRSGGEWSGDSSHLKDVLQHFTWDEGEKDRNETERMTLGVGSGQEEIGCASRGRGTGGPFPVVSKQSSV